MNRRSDPRRVVTRLGTVCAGLLVAILAGTEAASYAVSGVDPFYFSGSSVRAPRSLPSPSLDVDDAPSLSTTFPSMPEGQYYYYRPPPVTASYDAVPLAPERAVELTRRDQPIDRASESDAPLVDSYADDPEDDEAATPGYVANPPTEALPVDGEDHT